MDFPQRRVLWTLWILCVYFPLFLHLDHQPLHNFDEARLAVAAYEMSENGFSLVPTIEGKPDMWSVKPPLLIWLQTISIHLLGLNELAVRLPVSLFGLLAIFAVTFTGQRLMPEAHWGFISGMILLVSPAFVGFHVTRTADYDAAVCFWLLAQLFAFYRYLHSLSSKTNPQWLYLMAIAVAASVLTKSIVGFMYLPGLAIGTLLLGYGKDLLMSKHLYVAIVVALVPILTYFGLRESINPGYVQAVMENEWGGRYQIAQEGHYFSRTFYLELLTKEYFSYWLWALPFGLWGMWKAVAPIRQLMVLVLCCLLVFLTVISLSATQLHWYLAPTLPLLALWAGLGIATLIQQLTNTLPKKGKTALSIGLFLLLFSWPYAESVKRAYFPGNRFTLYFHDSRYGFVMRKLEKNYPFSLPTVASMRPAIRNDAHLLFYQAMWIGKGMPLSKTELTALEQGATVLICEEKYWPEIWSRYEYKVLYEEFPCQLIRITTVNVRKEDAIHHMDSLQPES